MRRGSLAIRRTPTQLVLGIVREIFQLGKRFFETHVGVGEDAGKVGNPGLKYNKASDERSWKAMASFLEEIFAG